MDKFLADQVSEDQFSAGTFSAEKSARKFQADKFGHSNSGWWWWCVFRDFVPWHKISETSRFVVVSRFQRFCALALFRSLACLFFKNQIIFREFQSNRVTGPGCPKCVRVAQFGNFQRFSEFFRDFENCETALSESAIQPAASVLVRSCRISSMGAISLRFQGPLLRTVRRRSCSFRITSGGFTLR